MKNESLHCLLPLLGVLLVLALPVAEAAETKKLGLVIDVPLTGAAAQALTDLQDALKKRGLEPARRRSGADKGLDEIIVGIAGVSPTVDALLAAERIDVPKTAESLCLHKLARNRLLVAGSVVRGLGYALQEAARAIELAPESQAPARRTTDIIRGCHA
jgi:hypothetical protein